MSTLHRRSVRPKLEPLEAREVPAAFADFNGDGFGDLAISDPLADDDAITNFGAVHIVYGSSAGLNTEATQLWTQDSFGIDDTAEASDAFGIVLATGDFNGDGNSDLAIGAPYESVETTGTSGVVHVLYGSTDGLTHVDSQIWSQDSPGIANAIGEFGSSLTAGDFNGDGSDDLAVGVFDPVWFGAGAVHVIYGSPQRLTPAGSQLWSQDSEGIRGSSEPGDGFGSSLASGDFDGNGKDDLAIGVRYETLSGAYQAGAVNVIYGRAAGLSSFGNQLWSQNTWLIKDKAEAGDQFGAELAVGDFDGNGKDDLAIGVPFEDVGGVVDAGAVHVVYGKATRPSPGLTSDNTQFWTQNSYGITDQAELDDFFGVALSVGDFNGNGKSDLAIGAATETLGGASRVGAVHVIYGTSSGLSAANSQYFTQATAGIPGGPEKDDTFGSVLATGDFDGDGKRDLAIGIPNELIGSQSGVTRGAVQVLYGTSNRLNSTNNQLLSPESIGIADGDGFGWELASC